MLKDIETEYTFGFVVIVFIIGGLSIGEQTSFPLLAMPMTRYVHGNLVVGNSICLLLKKLLLELQQGRGLFFTRTFFSKIFFAN